ncbi:MAG: large-conductance mechanosensitive channel protein MscL [Firmicutes bacterium]|nr:large-conductance mechanosensitive channel protein MscL [Bacillota bacterium]
MKFFEEFKKFIYRGNVLDMAVGVVMGTAFTKIVNSLVENIITPVIGVITGKVNVSTLEIKIQDTLTIPYGMFLQSVIDFLLIAISVFIMIKFMNAAREKFAKKETKAVETKTPEPSKEELLLTEIRDLLKEQNK